MNADRPFTLTARVAGGLRLEAAVASLEDASRLWNQFRDGVSFGGSEMTSQPTVRDENGKKVAFISYNGVVWPPKRWIPGLEPLLDSQTGLEHDCVELAVAEDSGGPLGTAYICSRCHTIVSVG